MREKFQKRQTVNEFNKMSTIPMGCNLYNNNNSTFVSPIYTFSLAGNIIVYTPNQGKNREKHLNHIVYKRKNADSGGK